MAGHAVNRFYHGQRQIAGRVLAKANGWTYLPAYETFLAANVRSELMADGIHPLPAGAQRWATAMVNLIAAHE